MLFGKLFGKGSKKNDKSKDDSSAKKEEKITIKTPFTTFYYINNPPHEIGYEAELEWYERPQEGPERFRYNPVGCYIDCDTPDTTEASLCLERLTRLFEDRKWTDGKVKLDVAENLKGEDGLIKDYSGNPVSKDELMDNLKIRFITVYRDGSIAYSLDHHCTLDTESDVHIVYAVNGDISIKSDSEFYGFN